MVESSAASLEQADLVLRSQGKTFAWARRFLGARHAERATRLYAFCRHVDDLADEADDADRALEALDRVRDQLDGNVQPEPVVRGALEVFDGATPALRAAQDLIDGVAGDLGTVRFETERELLRYCYRVAGTVGVMMCHALDRREPAAYPHAIDLGIAMQLTNISRDIHEDAGLGRRYVPASIVGDLAPETILAPGPGERMRLAEGRQRLLRLAEQYYGSGERGLAFLPVRARAAILIAAETYRAIGPRARALGQVLDHRAHVPTAGKLAVTARCILGRVPRPDFWSLPGGHESGLHEHLCAAPSLVPAGGDGG